MCREYELFKYCSKKDVAAYFGVELKSEKGGVKNNGKETD